MQAIEALLSETFSFFCGIGGGLCWLHLSTW
jgi:hypothetical protein